MSASACPGVGPKPARHSRRRAWASVIEVPGDWTGAGAGGEVAAGGETAAGGEAGAEGEARVTGGAPCGLVK
ncbi:MAG TPA: hypothetical protein VNY31_05695 [Solirubrobacteraceae bacterium]|nr:hypothetical protein [Solirubrobacteraceae bacterium]